MKLKTLLSLAIIFSISCSAQPSEFDSIVNSLDSATRTTLIFVNKFIDSQERSEKFSDQIDQAKKMIDEDEKLSVEVKNLLINPSLSDVSRKIINCINEISDIIIPALKQLYVAMASQRGKRDTTALSAALKPPLLNIAAQSPFLKNKIAELRIFLSIENPILAQKVIQLEKEISDTVSQIEIITGNGMKLVNLFAAFKVRLLNG